MIGVLRRHNLVRYTSNVDRLVRARAGANLAVTLLRNYQGGKTPHSSPAKPSPAPPTPSQPPPPTNPPSKPEIPTPPPGQGKLNIPLLLGGSAVLLGGAGAAWWQYELGRWGPGPVIPEGGGGVYSGRKEGGEEAAEGLEIPETLVTSSVTSSGTDEGASEVSSPAADSADGGGEVGVQEVGVGEEVVTEAESIVAEGNEAVADVAGRVEEGVEEGKEKVEEMIEGGGEGEGEREGAAGGERGGWGQPEDEFVLQGGGGGEVAGGEGGEGETTSHQDGLPDQQAEEESADLADLPGQLADVATEVGEELGGGEDGRLRSYCDESRTAEALFLAGHEAAVRRAQDKKTEEEAAQVLKAAKLAEEEERTPWDVGGEEKKGGEKEEGEGEGGEEGAELAKMAKLINAVAEAAKQEQAEVDAKVIENLRADLEKRHQRELNEERAQTLRLGEEVHQKEREAQRQKQEGERLKREMVKKAEAELKRAMEKKDEESALSLEEAKLGVEVKAAAELAAERAEGLNTMTGINVQVKALRKAFFTKSEATRKSHGAHKIAMSTFSLEEALSRGIPLGGEVSILEGAVGGKGQDPLVDAIIASLPPAALQNGTPTRVQLQRQLAASESLIRHLSLLPPDAGGVLAHGLAKVVSALKVKEDGNGEGNGVEASLARAELLLAEGRLSDAAQAVEEGVRGTKAEGIAQQWVEDARNRAVAEQALEVIQAHSTALAAGLS